MATKAFSNARIDITAKDRTASAFKSVNQSISTVSKSAMAMGGAFLAVAGIGGMGALIKSNLTLIDDLAKTSDRLGVTTQSLQAMRHASGLAGVSNATLDKSLEKLNVNLATATKGTGATAEALDRLGLSADILAKTPTDEALKEIADAMKEVETYSEKAKIAQDLFGRSGIEMINMLDGGSDAIKEASEWMDEYNLSLSRADAAKVEEANDAFDNAVKVIGQVGQILAVQLAPIITAVSNLFVQTAKDTGGFAEFSNKVIWSVVETVGYLRKSIWGIRMAWISVQVVFSKVAEILMEGVEMIAKPIVRLLSIIPRLGVDYEETMALMGDATANVVKQTNDLQNSLMDVIDEGDPLERTREFYNEAMELAEENAILVEEWQMEKQAREREILEEHEDEKTDIETKGNKDRLKNYKRSLSDREKFTLMTISQRAKYTAQEAVNMTAMASSTSKKMFAINKVAGVANALIGTYQGVAKALGGYIFPLNIAMAALSFASGMANVSALRSVSFGGGGGGSAPSGGGSASASLPSDLMPDEPQAEESTGSVKTQDATIVNIELQGSGFSKEGVRDLIDQINEEIGDGVFLTPVMGQAI